MTGRGISSAAYRHLLNLLSIADYRRAKSRDTHKQAAEMA